MSKEFAVIFKTKRSLPIPETYTQVNSQLAEMVKGQKGFIRIESVADDQGKGISISYWESLDDIRAWKENKVHLGAQEMGKSSWYEDYSVEICEVLRAYGKGSG